MNSSEVPRNHHLTESSFPVQPLNVLRSFLRHVVGRIEPADAETLARAVVERMSVEEDVPDRSLAPPILIALIRRLSTEDAKFFDPLLRRMVSDLTRAGYISRRHGMYESIRAMVDRLTAVEQSTLAHGLAGMLTSDSEASGAVLDEGSQLLSELARRLPPADAAAITIPVARRLTSALIREFDKSDRNVSHARALAHMAEWLPQTQAVEATRLLLTTAVQSDITKSSKGDVFRPLASLSRRVPPADAAAFARQLADLSHEAKGPDTTSRSGIFPTGSGGLSGTFSQRHDPSQLVVALDAMADRLPAADAAAVCGPVAARLADWITSEIPEKPWRGPVHDATAYLAQLLRKLPAGEATRLATRVADLLVDQMGHDGWEGWDQRYGLVALFEHLTDADLARLERHCGVLPSVRDGILAEFNRRNPQPAPNPVAAVTGGLAVNTRPFRDWQGQRI